MNHQPRRAITLVGVSDDGCASLSSRAWNAVNRAAVLAGGERQLAFFPEFTGEKVVLKGGLLQTLDELGERAAEDNVCILASGDPGFFGIGRLVQKRLGSDHVEVIPQATAMQWAFARLGLSWQDAGFLSVHGRPIAGFVNRLRPWQTVACYTDAENSPARLAARMLEFGETDWQATVCENLCGPGERIRHFTLEELAEVRDVQPLNTLVLQRTGDKERRPPPRTAYLPEAAFAKKVPKAGLITKREVRALVLANLRLHPGAVLWDIGAGSGSVAIEAAMQLTDGRVFAIECDEECLSCCEANIRTHGTDNVEIIAGRAPAMLPELAAPDGVFIGGSKGSLADILRISWERLLPGGVLVVNAVTLDNVTEAYRTFKEIGRQPELTLMNFSRGRSLAGKYLRYEGENPIHIFTVEKSHAADR